MSACPASAAGLPSREEVQPRARLWPFHCPCPASSRGQGRATCARVGAGMSSFSSPSIQALPRGPLLQPLNLTPPLLIIFLSPERFQKGLEGPWAGLHASSTWERGLQAQGCRADQTPSRARACSWVASPPGGRLALHRCLGRSICLAMARGGEGAKSARCQGIVEAHVGGFGSRTETSQLGIGIC